MNVRILKEEKACMREEDSRREESDSVLVLSLLFLLWFMSWRSYDEGGGAFGDDGSRLSSSSSYPSW